MFVQGGVRGMDENSFSFLFSVDFLLCAVFVASRFILTDLLLFQIVRQKTITLLQVPLPDFDRSRPVEIVLVLL